MQLTPRYDGPPVIALEAPTVDLGTLLVQQRRRLADLLAGLTDDQWQAPTRCDAWTVADVVNHLVTVTKFFEISIMAGRAGQPTRFLADFDPVTSPATLVEANRTTPPEELLARFRADTDSLAGAVSGLDPNGWEAIGEAPPGHISIQGVALHGLWDSWVHERDIALPLGIEPTVDADEVRECLRYAVALGPAFVLAGGEDRHGTLAVTTTDPEAAYVVEVGTVVEVRSGTCDTADVRLDGPGVGLLEALSSRQPFEVEVAAEHRWLLDGLRTVFDQVR